VNEDIIEFNYPRTMKLIKSDDFLTYLFRSTKGRSDSEKSKSIFNNYILGDKDLRKRYSKI
jgi:hypothetical protein